MTVIHVIFLKFKDECSPETLEAAWQQTWAMKEKCINPKTGKPYILDMVSGRNFSPVPNDVGYTHVSKMEFENNEDCRYFLEKDPVHEELKPVFINIIDKFMIMDFTPGLMEV